MKIKTINKSELGKWNTLGAEFFCFVDDDIRKRFENHTENMAKKELDKLYGMDDRIRRIFDGLVAGVLRSTNLGNKKIILASFYQSLKNLGFTREEIVSKFLKYKALEKEFKAMMANTSF